MARRGSPSQLPLGDVDMGAYGFGDEASRKEMLSGAASDQAEQAFCDSLTDYNWQSTDLEGLLREEAIYSRGGERQVPQLDEAMADTALDILTDGPSAEQGPDAAEEPATVSVPAFSQPASMPGTPSAAAAAARTSPAMSPGGAAPAADMPLDSRDTSSQESSEPLRAAGTGRLARTSRSAMSSRQSLAAEAGDQADTPRKARKQAHAMLEFQRDQMEQERYQLQAQAMQLQAKQMQLHRDYVALQLGPTDAPMLYAGQQLGASDMSSKQQQLGSGCSAGDVLRVNSALGSASASGASGFSRDSNYSSQFRHSHPPQQSLGKSMPSYGNPYGSMSGGAPAHMLGTPQQPQQQQSQDPQRSGSVLASPAQSMDQQQRQALTMQQPGFAPSQQPHHPYGDPLLMLGWQPRPPSYYNPAGAPVPFPGSVGALPAAVQAAPPTVEQPPSSEACMLGELKLLIDQLDQQTKATMKDSLYRISRHAQGATMPKVQQAAVAQGAGPSADSGTADDISPVDRMVADLLYKDHAAHMPAFAASLAMQPLPAMQRQMPSAMHLMSQRPTASDQGSAAFMARHHGRDTGVVPQGGATVSGPATM